MSVLSLRAEVGESGLGGPRGGMRIVHVAPSLSPNYGGPSTVVVRLAAAQAARGCRVSILSNLPPEDRTAYLSSTRYIPHFHAVEKRLSPWSTSLRRWMGARLIGTYREMFEGADVVQIHGIWEPMLPMAAAVARNMGVPYVVRPCGMLDPWSLRQRWLKKQVAMKLCHKHMLDRAAFLHVLNDEESRLIEPLNVRAPHVVIPNGVFLQETDAADHPGFFERLPELRTHPYIVFVGRLHYKKGLDLLAEAFTKVAARVPDVRLLVVGPDEGARGSFEEQIRRAGLSHRVHVPGALVGAEKFTAYRHASCFCLPSRQEGFSNAIVEALACGVPAAISEACHFAEVERIGAGKVFELRSEAIAGSLIDLLTASATVRQGMTRAARAYVEAHLTWSQVAERTILAYRNVARAGVRRSAIA